MFPEEQTGLAYQQEKSGIRRPLTLEPRCGRGFVPTYKKGEKGKYQTVVKKQSWENLKRKLKGITKKNLTIQLEERLQKLREVWMGWVNNYRLASIQAKLKQLDEWLRNRTQDIAFGMTGKSLSETQKPN
ncbi:group II intron maturase-specific domain-containing protein [Algoriphagus halophilus]|uniref:group II intron maturase-specific domain-containing protein n=1 Tax=Algoriphagus halophilus TaxID=226505 RepID=UPI00358ED7B3